MEIFLAEIRQPLHANFFCFCIFVLFCCQAWNTQSALQILSVVLEYSDSSILDYLYGIVEHVRLTKPLYQVVGPLSLIAESIQIGCK